MVAQVCGEGITATCNFRFCTFESCCYHVEVVLRVCSPLQIPDEDVPVMAGRQDDPGVERVRLQDKHLSLMALNKTHTLVRTWKR